MTAEQSQIQERVVPGGPAWHRAGAAWGRAAVDWATLVEPWQMPVYDAVFDALRPPGGSELLDVACGSGLAMLDATRRGLFVAGIDASAALVAIARCRLPGADVRVGDMFHLPWGDASFDVVTSFNGIWAGGDAAMREVRRVLRDGGRVAVTFWGNPKRLDLGRTWGRALAELLPPEEYGTASALLDIGRPGVAEAMLEAVNIEPGDRATVACTQEYPDIDTAIRALSSPGAVTPAIEHSGWDAWRRRLGEVLEPFRDEAGVVRLRNEWGYLLGQG